LENVLPSPSKLKLLTDLVERVLNNLGNVLLQPFVETVFAILHPYSR
jgi:hypothetical protein